MSDPKPKIDLDDLRRRSRCALGFHRYEEEALISVVEAALAVVAAEDMEPHTPFDGNSPEWDTKFDAEHAANKALRAALAPFRKGGE